ncbi:hypothetical protein [Brevundimonas sp.]|uniref:hypothetical protein n=1 Tax=Brevundimonas sp. TaxID=1871086 RepID=UPI0025C3CFE3|nr:hypothetical protein [Brevundimonas sp.]
MCGIAVVRLAGFHNLPSVDGFYAACQFRKVQRRDLSAWLETATDFEEPRRAPQKEPA